MVIDCDKFVLIDVNWPLNTTFMITFKLQHDCVDSGGKLRHNFHISGLNWDKYAWWQVISSVTKASDIMTSSNGNISALLAICAGNSPVTMNSPHKGQWRRALMFSLICAWIHRWVNNGQAVDLKRNVVHYDVTVMRDTVPSIPLTCTISVRFDDPLMSKSTT